MTDLAPVLTGCHVCRSSDVDKINNWLRKGVSQIDVSRRLSEAGTPISRITIGKHARRHLMSPFDQARRAATEKMRRDQKTFKGPSTQDFAAAVRDTALDKLLSGEMEVTATHGLAAQKLLDDRIEKGADRNLVLILAQILGGARPQEIEGEYRDVSPEALDDAAEFAQLTAG
jgi:hypothetical protein